MMDGYLPNFVSKEYLYGNEAIYFQQKMFMTN